MASKNDISELLEKVKAATGPDRELDLALAAALVPDVIVGRQRDDDSGSDPYTHWEYTASIDAALALVERVLPLRDHDYVRLTGRHRFSLSLPGAHKFSVTEHGATGPLAILAALLSALEATP